MQRIVLLFTFLISSCIIFSQCPNHLVYLGSQSAVDNFAVTYPNCTIITNGLAIANSADITDLTPLSVITSVSGTTDEDLITIRNNAVLENLDGLENINIGNPNGRYIDIMNNPVLTNIQGLSGINGSWHMGLNIANNPLLQSLQGLENIDLSNNISIYNNDALVNFTGLEGIIGLDYMVLKDNDALIDLSGLDNLEAVGDLFIRENANLVSVNGLNSLGIISGVDLKDNPNLNDISQFDDTTLSIQFGGLHISNNPNLAVCTNNMVCTFIENGGFSNVENNAPGCNSVLEVEAQCDLINQCPSGNITLMSQAEIDAFAVNYPNCTELSALSISGQDITNLTGLHGITSISVWLDIKDNPNLISLDGLSPITFAEEALYLNIRNNSSLESLSEFSGALDENDYGGLYVSNNPNLSSLVGLSGITRVDGLHIRNNPLLTNLNGLSGIYEVGQVRITENTNLSSLDGLSAIEFTLEPRALEISDNPVLLSLSEFSGALSGQDQEDGLRIKNNLSLLSLQGLSGILSASGLEIVNNDMLQDLEGLSGIIAAGNLKIQDNDALISTAGLEMIHLDSSLYIKNNVNLENMYSLTSSSGYTEWVGIYDNPKLVSLSGLEGLDDIQVEGLAIVNNDLLINLEGLNNLNHVWFNIRIGDNELLSDISVLETLALGNLDYWSITGNPNLSQCAISTLCAYLGNGEMANIENNGPSCNSVSEVEAQCNLSISELELSQKLSVFPNPASEILFINASEGIIVQGATVYSILGEQLFETSERSVNVSSLCEGIYFMQIETDLGSIMKRLIKK